MSDLIKTAPTLAMLRDVRDRILELAARHGAMNVRVFGSVARGTATPDSDIDFLVDWDYQRLTAWGSAGLWDELAALLGHPVDIASADELHWYVRDRVLREAVPL
jgi:hypothetical protein